MLPFFNGISACGSFVAGVLFSLILARYAGTLVLLVCTGILDVYRELDRGVAPAADR